MVAGDCTRGTDGTEIWQFEPDSTHDNGTWSKSKFSAGMVSTNSDTALGSNFLSSGVSFPQDAENSSSDIYVFGGMCPTPDATIDASSWTSSASYSNRMLAFSPSTSGASTQNSRRMYGLSSVANRGSPIPEAGLTMTPLSPSYMNASGEAAIQGQNFVLIGGHTSTAFINMSQVALFSLPEQSWAFISVNQPSQDPQTELAVRLSNAADVEPRSGHTALLSPEGDRIIIFGGWVGDINTPATPQLAVLELGSGYGGQGEWTWTVPNQVSSPLTDEQGIYGHGAAMLPGGVMLVMGGYTMTAPGTARHKSRRQSPPALVQNSRHYLFNITSNTWISSYNNPLATATGNKGTSPQQSGSLRTTSQKAGLGAGLVLGCSCLIGLFIVYLWYSRRLRRKREAREKELYDLALGARRYQEDILQSGIDGRGGYPEMQTIGTIKRKPVPNSQNDYPWAPLSSISQASGSNVDATGSGERDAERTGLLVEIPSPTRGLRRSLYSRQPPTSNYGNAGRGGIHTIDERAEYEENGSVKRAGSRGADLAANPHRRSDPFKDPPPQLVPTQSTLERTPSETKRQRMAEIQGWVDDWTAAASKLELTRDPSLISRSQSNSQSHSQSHSTSGRGSPDKSDRTGSNLSEASMMTSSSLQKSNIGTVRRNPSNRSVSASYAQALFAGAAAAMNRVYAVTGSQDPTETNSVPQRSVSGPAGQFRRSASLTLPNTSTFASSSQVTTLRPSTSAGPESEGLLRTYKTNLANNSRPEELFATPPESPIKEKPPSLNTPQYAYTSLLPTTTSTANGTSASNNSRRGPLGFLGSVKRALTGSAGTNAGGGAVRRRVLEYESRSSSSSPTKGYHYHSANSSPTREMAEGSPSNGPNRAGSSAAAFWRGRKGRKDWDDKISSDGPSAEDDSRPSGELEDDEWDIERAVQDRLVQVMFTVPKERLRVVNVDQDRLSISDVDFEGGENAGGMDVRDRQVPMRMDEVHEILNQEGEAVQEKGKGKEKA